jgi:DNA invertase Pin-like site-specific DNA recombinase
MSVKAYSYIRWSSKAQTEGDSLRRQLRSSRAWAAKKGIELDETLRDEGVSSFRGTNRKKGDLGKFIAQVMDGRVSPGSYLLIDEFSRLGREPEVQMMHTLTTLILKGVIVVTMNDEKEYGLDSAKEERLMGALHAISIAHHGIAKQGRLVREAHGESKRRAREEGRRWHAAGPSWLEAEVTGKGADREINFIRIEDRVRTVQRIFDLIEAGMGTSAIAVRFNTEDPSVPPFKHAANGWQHAAVLGIAKSRTVLGEYQPQLSTQGSARAGRSPDGPPIPGYYPAIIDEDQYNRVQAIIDGRRRGANRKGSARAITNLFQGVTRCGVCGGTVGIHSSTARPNKSVLRCVDSGRGLCTNRKPLSVSRVRADHSCHRQEHRPDRSGGARTRRKQTRP